jgi:nicotinate-nucleotide adenylyltransferase
LRIAIFGGTFDPIHNAHLIVAREAVDAFQLDHVLFVPSSNPPHKPGGSTTSYESRYRMVELACAADPRFVASRAEDGSAPSYSILTIEKVKRSLNDGDRLFFLIGADAFADIGAWHRAAEVLAAVEFIVAARPGYQYPIPEGARVLRLETVALPVSSSEIRFRLEAGDEPDELPQAVLDYIRENRLYLCPE